MVKYFKYLLLGSFFVDPGSRAVLRYSSAAFIILGLRVLNPLRLWVFVTCVCCVFCR